MRQPKPLPIKSSAKSVIGLDDLTPAAPARYLVEYLRATGKIVVLDQSVYVWMPGKRWSTSAVIPLPRHERPQLVNHRLDPDSFHSGRVIF
jgi:hypothetical protein